MKKFFLISAVALVLSSCNYFKKSTQDTNVVDSTAQKVVVDSVVVDSTAQKVVVDSVVVDSIVK